MSKLLDLIDKRIEQKMNAQDSIKYAPAEVLAVYKNEQDIIVRADVELIANGTVIKNMLNKTSEKLTVGQGVKVAYLTLPSAGWIAVANGEADPMGSGGGSTVSIESAAILNSGNFSEFNITEELMLDYSAQNKFYYGGRPAFCILQGHYCLFAQGNVSTSGSNPYGTIDGSSELMQIVGDNSELFGSAIGDVSTGENGLVFYSGSSNVDVWAFRAYDQSIVLNRFPATDSTAPDVPYVTENAYMLRRGGSYTAPDTSSFVMPTAPTTIGGDTTYSGGIYAPGTERCITGKTNNYRTEYAEELIIVPIVTSVSESLTLGTRSTPYGYANIMLRMFAKTEKGWAHVQTTYTPTGYAPFASQAEYDFARGVTKRSEPVEVEP